MKIKTAERASFLLKEIEEVKSLTQNIKLSEEIEIKTKIPLKAMSGFFGSYKEGIVSMRGDSMRVVLCSLQDYLKAREEELESL